MEMKAQKQNITIVVLALIHVFITVVCFHSVDKVTEFTLSLDQQFPMRFYLIYGTNLTPIITAIILGGYFFKHRQKLSKNDVIEIWINVLPWMCALSVVILVWTIRDPLYDPVFINMI